MNAKERAERNDRVLELFMQGASYRLIATKGLEGVRTPGAAHKIVEKGLREAAQRRALLSDEALAIHQERQERLLAAHFARAIGSDTVAPDHRSAELVRRILAAQARLYGLEDEGGAGLPAPTTPTGPLTDEDDGPEDELAELRSRRTSGS